MENINIKELLDKVGVAKTIEILLKIEYDKGYNDGYNECHEYYSDIEIVEGD